MTPRTAAVETIEQAFPDLFVPGPVLPNLTAPGRIHDAVEVNAAMIHNTTQASSYVRTRCGIPNLGPCQPYRRGEGFPDCQRCYPT